MAKSSLIRVWYNDITSQLCSSFYETLYCYCIGNSFLFVKNFMNRKSDIKIYLILFYECFININPFLTDNETAFFLFQDILALERYLIK